MTARETGVSKVGGRAENGEENIFCFYIFVFILLFFSSFLPILRILLLWTRKERHCLQSISDQAEELSLRCTWYLHHINHHTVSLS